MSDETATTPSIHERLAQARAAKADLDKAKADEDLSYEFARLELELKLTKELGPINVDFAIVDTSTVPVAVKLVAGGEVLHKQFTNTKITDESTIDFAKAHLASPSVDVFKELLSKRPAIAARCTNALLDLYAGRRKVEEGK